MFQSKLAYLNWGLCAVYKCANYDVGNDDGFRVIRRMSYVRLWPKIQHHATE